MQRRIGESGVEGLAELELRGVHQPGVEAARPGRADHAEVVVDAHHARAALDDLPGESAVAATDVEDMLARLRVEQVESRLPELGDEPADARVIARIPVAGRDGGFPQSDFTHSR